MFKSEDKSLYEDECNRIISQNVSANEFKTVRDFAIWYKEYSKKIVQEIEIDDKVIPTEEELLNVYGENTDESGESNIPIYSPYNLPVNS